LLGVLGAPPNLRPRLVLMLAALLGIVGSLLGIGLGIALAWILLGLIGGDLGGGYFAATRPALHIPAGTVALFAGLGLLAALAGALSPALKLKQMAPAQALKGGQAMQLPDHLAPAMISLLLALTGAALLAVPAIDGLPLAAYLAIACWLFAGVLIIAPLLGHMAHWLAAHSSHLPDALSWLAVARLDNAHQAAFPALAGVVASFALVSSMAIMVHSFRVSVDDWLEEILPADLYLRVHTNSRDAAFTAADRNRLASIENVQRISFLRSIELLIDPRLAPLTLLARSIDSADPGAVLPMTGDTLDTAARNAQCIAVYASEPASRLYGWQVGDSITLPLSLTDQIKSPPCYQVAGIWRDYARQQGALSIDLGDYRRLSGDHSVSDAAVWLDKNSKPEAVIAAIHNALPNLQGLQIRSAAGIRELSLGIFDRSFTVTYALEAIALLVGLFGVATTYSGEALARIREFGMLRHLGVTRLQLARLFATESLLGIALGVGWGACLGALISQVLIHRVNPQSFNWSMQTHWPTDKLLLGALALVGLGIITAMFAARHAAGRAPIAAVRADW
jgi:putative ABC transport system permease protein